MASWSPDDIRQNSRNWTLEGDAKLLEFMQSISQNLENRCTTTKKNINGMLLKLDETNISLGNTTNKLLALQHSQFVENRVYEEDETIANIEEVPNVVKTKPSELTSMESIQLAIDNGIKMMHNCYEKVSLDLDDDSDNEGDDENGNMSIAFRAKDPYLEQPIPFIIGSKDWKEKWHIGIVESDIESDNDDAEQFSESSSDNPSLSGSLPSIAPTISESESGSGSIWGLHTTTTTIQPQKSNYSDDDSIIKSEKKSNQVLPTDPIVQQPQLVVHNTQQVPPIPKQRGLFDYSDISDSEPEVKTNVPPVVKKVVPPTSDYFRNQPQKRQTINLFNEDPPEMDFPPEPSNYQRKTINLFADSDDDDLFPNQQRAIPTKKTSLFDDEPPPPLISSLPSRTVQPKRNLFDDGDESEEEVEKITVAKSKPTKSGEPIAAAVVNSAPIAKPRIANLFEDDNEPVDFFDEIMKSSVQTISQPVRQSTSTPVEVKKKTEPTNPTQINKIAQSKPKVQNLFDDELPPENDFDDFLSKPNAKKSVPIKQTKSKSLFDDESSGDDDLFGSTKKIAPKVNPPIVDNDVKKQVAVSVPIPDLFAGDGHFDVTTKKSESTNLFDDGPKETPPSLNNGLTNNLTNDLFSDNDAGTPPLPSIPIEVPVPPVSKKSKLTSLFSDDEDTLNDDFDDIFTSKGGLIRSTLSTVTIAKEEIGETMTDEPISETFDIPPPLEEVEEAKQEKIPPIIEKEQPKLTHQNLFLDDPPPSDTETDDWLASSTSETFESSTVTETIDKPKQQSSSLSPLLSSALNYNQIGLFDDLPPDDDGLFSTPPPTTIHKKTQLYYDDTESFLTPPGVDQQQQSKVGSVSYMLGDEPPPVDVDDVILDDEGRDEVDEEPMPDFKEKLGIFSQIPTNLTPKSPLQPTTDSVIDIPVKKSSVAELIASRNNNKSDDIEPSSINSPPKRLSSPPKKLNTNFNINVGALLPGARPPPLKRDEVTKTTTTSESSSSEEIIERTPKYNNNNNSSSQRMEQSSSTSMDGESRILSSLNKNRAKIQVKRKPSTRRGRQEIYEKTKVNLSDEVVKVVTAEVTQLETPTAIVPVFPPSIMKVQPKLNQKSLFIDDNEDDQDDDDDLFSKITTTQSRAKTIAAATIKKTASTKAAHIPIPISDPAPVLSPIKQTTGGLFSSDEGEDHLSLFSKVGNKKKKDFTQSNVPSVVTNKNVMTTTSSLKTKKTASVFASDDDDDTDLFGGGSVTKTVPKKTLPKKPTENLFGDSDDDDEDIFKTSTKSTVSTSRKPMSQQQSIADKKIIKPSSNPINNDPLSDLLK